MIAASLKDDKYLYCANAIMSLAIKENAKVFALTSSFTDSAKQSEVFKKITEKIRQLGKSVLSLDMNSESAEDIQKKLEDNDIQKSNDFIFVTLLPVNRHFSAIQTAQKCQGTILLEKYTRTMHKEFDELMDTLIQNEIHVYGAVTY